MTDKAWDAEWVCIKCRKEGDRETVKTNCVCETPEESYHAVWNRNSDGYIRYTVFVPIKDATSEESSED